MGVPGFCIVSTVGVVGLSAVGVVGVKTLEVEDRDAGGILTLSVPGFIVFKL